jgi:hypothetical protein
MAAIMNFEHYTENKGELMFGKRALELGSSFQN